MQTGESGFDPALARMTGFCVVADVEESSERFGGTHKPVLASEELQWRSSQSLYESEGRLTGDEQLSAFVCLDCWQVFFENGPPNAAAF